MFALSRRKSEVCWDEFPGCRWIIGGCGQRLCRLILADLQTRNILFVFPSITFQIITSSNSDTELFSSLFHPQLIFFIPGPRSWLPRAPPIFHSWYHVENVMGSYWRNLVSTNCELLWSAVLNDCFLEFADVFTDSTVRSDASKTTSGYNAAI